LKLFWIILFSTFIHHSFAQDWTIKVDYIYDYVSEYSDGLATIEKDGHYGFINDNGKIVIPPKYDHTSGFYNGVATVEKDGLFFVINKEGKQISDDYEAAHRSGYVYAPNEDIDVKKNGKWGILDSLMNVVLPCQYENPPNVFGDRVIVFEADGKVGMKTRTNEEVLPSIYDYIYCYGDYFFCELNDSAAFFSRSGEQVTSFKYGNFLLPQFADGYFVVSYYKSLFKKEVLNSKLEVVGSVNRNYDHIDESLFITYDSNYVNGVLDIETNQWKIKHDSLSLSVYDSGHLIYTTPSKKKGLMDISGKVLIPAGHYSFYNIDQFSMKDLGIVGLDLEVNEPGIHRKFYCYSTGFIPPVDYEYIQISDCGQYISATRGGITTVYNIDGRILGENFLTGSQAKIHGGGLSVKNDKGKYGLIQFK
jgi:hypothetical protein